MTLHPTVEAVTEKIRRRSASVRSHYLDQIKRMGERTPRRHKLGCANIAHAIAACGPGDKGSLEGEGALSIGIVTSYNDMLSAHQPFETYPQIIKDAVREAGGVAQVAGGVPAMCDGVTQGFAGMELSLFSRDTIALGTAVALSHDTFDGALALGVCDKIVPGLLMGALAFGHLPMIFVPAGPMTTGASNDEKSRVRQLYAEGKIGRKELLASETASYHGPGTCTFYGTANSNQMMMEMMGLHMPGAAFVNPGTPLRDALTRAAAKRVTEITALGNDWTPIGEVVDEKAIVNGVVGLHATGGSTNHTIHLVAIARAAGIDLTWEDMAELSEVTPLLARVYPNGMSDVNQFHAAGGMSLLVQELLEAGLLHGDVKTVAGDGGLARYAEEPKLVDGELVWGSGTPQSLDRNIIRTVDQPFDAKGGLVLLRGNLGRAVIKVSAVKPERRVVEAPARVFHDQSEVQAAFKDGELDRDVVCVLRFQGPKANGMPELHKLTPTLGILQDRGFKVALVTDGRMSGASGKIPAAIHLTPEATDGGPIARIQDGDMVRLDAVAGTLDVLVDAAEFTARETAIADLSHYHHGIGRELFAPFRAAVGPADKGAVVVGGPFGIAA
ncbi:phosphogluconate dehydratase [Geminicoccus sp.]|uniref:phosphogluconate dehydratase n=1 Tax=Geminicoccus sp. TaxID=2024832 RepID=UPI0032C24107